MKMEEAIKRIKTRFDKWALDNEDMKAIQTLIPELADSEDERTRKEIISFIEYEEACGNIPDGWHQAKRPGEWIAYLEKQKEQKPAEWSEEDENAIRFSIDWLSIFRDRHAINQETKEEISFCIDKLKSLRPQPKQEWSEENINMLDLLRAYLNGDAQLSISMKQALITFLNSLTSQSHWKPSEEQMEALKYALGNGGKYDKAALESLYNDLKKRM